MGSVNHDNLSGILVMTFLVCCCGVGLYLTARMIHAKFTHAGEYLHEISQISYTAHSGPVLPELQWYEEIIISKTAVSIFSRNGNATATENTERMWVCDVNKQKVAAVFEQLEAVHLPTVERIEPESPVDGGDTIGYTITYGSHKTFSLVYDPGVSYAHGELIVAPIEAFIQDVKRKKDEEKTCQESSDL